MKTWLLSAAAVPLLVAGPLARPAEGQVVDQMKQAAGKATEATRNAIQSLNFTDVEERQVGADVSARLRFKYGVVQDAAVHRYVSLVGSVLAQLSDRPQLKWTFIVLDTAGVNAFAAPAGYVHITRGALALIRNEAELACVLAHEIAHVTAKHTIRVLEKKRPISKFAAVTRLDFLSEAADRLYALTLENAFDRSDEVEADNLGVTLANRAGYAPSGLQSFLMRLRERNAGLSERSGFYASHPETNKRLEELTDLILDEEMKGAALVAPRYQQSVRYQQVPIATLEQVPPPAESLRNAPAQPKGSGLFGLGKVLPLGRERASSSTSSSAGTRGVNPDRDAKGGPNKALVVVTITAAQIATFRKGIV